MLMKKLWIICFMTLVGLHLAAQDIVYSTLKDLLAHKGDTVAALKIEKTDEESDFIVWRGRL